jgi:hypothetical protein
MRPSAYSNAAGRVRLRIQGLKTFSTFSISHDLVRLTVTR